MFKKSLLILLAAVVGVAALSLGTGSATTAVDRSYVVLLDGSQGTDGTFRPAAGTSVQAAKNLVTREGGTVTTDLTRQIGALLVSSNGGAFAADMRKAGGIFAVSENYAFKAFPSYEEAVASGELKVLDSAEVSSLSDTSRDTTQLAPDPLEQQQWDMDMIDTPQAHRIQNGRRNVDVGVLDSGIDSAHQDFQGPNGPTVDVARSRDFSIGQTGPTVDNQFHGTHVAGTIAAQKNGIGVVGVAPNVTLVAVKVCEASGFCFFNNVLMGLVYAGDIQLDVINMSFFTDDEPPAGSTEFKCRNDEQQLGYIEATQRAINYIRGRGTVPVAALGNSDTNLARLPSGPNCDVIPAETAGVIGVSALGNVSERAGYSNGGKPHNDVAAPGGNGTTGDCATTILSTLPGNAYGCIQGTSMASPHAAGVAALIMSQFGQNLTPAEVASRLQNTAIDIGPNGYDKCFGNGRIDALRAIQNDTAHVREPAPCNLPYSNE
ncbi:MAG: S8 family serine peptidase [Dehalococcoidia bacterium]